MSETGRLTELIVESALDAVVTTDDGGRILSWNPRAEEMFGWSRAEAIGRTMAETVLPPDRVAPYRQTLAALRRSEDARVRREGKGRDRDGAVFPVEVAIAAVRVGEGTATIVNFIRDLSAEKANLEELREANELLQALLDASPLPITVVDVDGRTTLWNPAAEREFGWKADEVLGEAPPMIPSEGREAWNEHRARVVGGETVTNISTRRRRRDGSSLDVNLSVAPVYGRDGNVSGSLGISMNVTEHRRAFELVRRSAEQRRRLLSSLLRAQEDERQRVAGDIHDDSVQVLTALALRLEMLRRKTDDPSLLASLAEAERTARLAITRLRHLMFELRPPVLDRDGLAAALRLQLEQGRQEHGLDVVLEDELEEEPDPDTRAIVFRIAQEALLNVVKHANARELSVRLGSNEDGVLVCVADDGRGFDVERVPGPQLGLAAMRERAEMAGGWLRISSAPGEGTTVDFSVPRTATPLGRVTAA